ncbi:ABC transporter substrate-binding protein [Acidimangrovimonas sediminis]|uniref:ABC transporter substrate-binding protein n=1 Tax=Acidimangrovimonas sediminis TaxID=2056283 RepID=UPI000C801278|nr:ABC transporter substrate-binding protein [Acidimangrovimonas sediminis]
MFNRLRLAAAVLLISAAPALAAKDSIVIGMQLEPPGLDPTSGAAAATDEVTYANVFQGLTRFGPEGQVEPDLATSWDVADGGKVWTFHLRKGVTFQDGTPFSAKDVKFSLDRARAKESTNAQKPLFAQISDVAVVDPETVKITLSEPVGAFAANMAWGDAQIVSEASIKDEATHPVGTGPFMFKDWVKGDKIDLAAYPGYWGEKPKLHGVTFKFISDPTAAFAAMMSGDINVFPGYPAPETLAQFKSDPRFQVIIGETQGETILAMNHRTPALSKLKVREAIAHAINRKDLIEGAMFGYGTAIGTHFPPFSPDYVDLTGLSNYDPALSKKLLDEAGVTGLKLRLALPPPSYARRSGQIIQAELKAVGIDVEITNMEWAQWLSQVFKGHDFDLTIVSHTEPNDINIYARPDYYFGYDNPKFQDLMKQLTVATDKTRRDAMLKEAQTIIAKDYVNAWLFQLPRLTVADAGIVGLWKNSPTQANDMTAVYWKD